LHTKQAIFSLDGQRQPFLCLIDKEFMDSLSIKHKPRVGRSLITISRGLPIIGRRLFFVFFLAPTASDKAFTFAGGAVNAQARYMPTHLQRLVEVACIVHKRTSFSLCAQTRPSVPGPRGAGRP